MKSLSPRPDTRFFETDVRGRTQGGIIALDGIHRTTTAYTIVAQELINVMTGAGVSFADRDGKPRAGTISVDVDHWKDSLIPHSPGSSMSSRQAPTPSTHSGPRSAPELGLKSPRAW